MSAGVTRLKHHLVNKAGQVKGCPNATTEIKKKVWKILHDKDKKKKESLRNAEILEKYSFGTGEDEDDDQQEEDDGLLWSDVREAMGGNVDVGPSTRSKREHYRDDDDDDQFGVGDEEEEGADKDDDINDLDMLNDVDSDADPVDCN